MKSPQVGTKIASGLLVVICTAWCLLEVAAEKSNRRLHLFSYFLLLGWVCTRIPENMASIVERLRASLQTHFPLRYLGGVLQKRKMLTWTKQRSSFPKSATVAHCPCAESLPNPYSSWSTFDHSAIPRRFLARAESLWDLGR